MILVRFYKNGFIVEGHSNYSTEGTDIVCSAVSGIVLGSLNWFKKNTIIDFKMVEEPPYIKLLLKETHENLLALSLLFKQLESIGNKYNQYLSLKRKNEVLK